MLSAEENRRNDASCGMRPDRTSERHQRSVLSHAPDSMKSDVWEGEEMKEFAESFYKSTQWERCRQNYLQSVCYLCERCKAKGLITPAKIVHHKEYITPENIGDPNITLNFNNMEALCQECHNKEHFKSQKRYEVDEFGNVMIKGE